MGPKRTDAKEPPRLPMLSGLLLFIMNVVAFLFSFLPQKIQMYVSTFMIGGLFGLTLPPMLMVYSFLHTCRQLVPYFPPPTYVIAGFGIGYLVTCLALDDSATKPLPLGVMRNRPNNWFEERVLSFWSTHFDYFPMKLVMDEDATLSLDKQYVFAVHPHGIHCWPLNVLAFPGSPLESFVPLVNSGRMTGLAATVIFQIPVVRELFLSMGYVDASRRVATQVLERGRNLVICTGGLEESMRTVVGQDCVVLKNRKGFVRLAVSHGASLVPVFGIGNSDLFTTYEFAMGFRMLLKDFGLAIPIFHGRWWSPLPYQRELNVVIGTPIQIDKKHIPSDKGDKPDDKIVDLYHAKYIEAVKGLHKRHGKGRPLIIR